MERFSESHSRKEPNEESSYNSLNGGRDSCLQSLAWILCINGLKNTLTKINISLKNEKNIENKNNIFFLAKGLEQIDNTALDGLIKSAKQKHKALKEQIRIICHAKIDKTEYLSTSRLERIKSSLLNIENNKKFKIGIESPMDTQSKIERTIKSWLTIKDPNEIPQEISAAYTRGEIPADLDIEGLMLDIREYCATELEKTRKSNKIKNSVIEFNIAIKSIKQKLIEELPEFASRALFRITEATRSNQEAYPPSLFGLHNIDRETIEILSKHNAT